MITWPMAGKACYRLLSGIDAVSGKQPVSTGTDLAPI